MNLFKTVLLGLCVFIINLPLISAAATIDFEDIYAAYGESSDPASFYSVSHGVTFSGDYFGVKGGVARGDSGNWDLDGTNGAAFLGNNITNGYLTAFSFDSTVNSVSFDVGLSHGQSGDFSVKGWLAGQLVDTVSFTLIDSPNLPTGTWDTINITTGLDYIEIDGTAGWGLDNIQYSSAVPEPATMILFGAGLLGIAGINRRKK